jgi:hypothetical protein
MDFQNSDGGAAGGNGGVDFSGVFGGGDGAGSGAGAGAGAGDGGAGGGEGGSGGGDGGQGGQGGAADPEWYGQLSSELGEGENASLRDWVKSIGAPDVNALAKIARDNQRAVRESGRIKVPGEGASAEELSTFRKAIGVPDDAKGYEVPVPKGADGQPLKGPDGQPVQLNAPLLDRLAGVAHQAGVPKAAYDALVQDFVQAQLEELGQADAKAQQEAQAKVAEWGREAPARQQDVNRGLAALGLSRDEALAVRSALGAGRAMDIFQKLGSGLSEDVMMSGSGGGQRFGMAPSEAQAYLDSVKKDTTLGAKVMVPGSPEAARYNRALDVVAAERERQARGG